MLAPREVNLDRKMVRAEQGRQKSRNEHICKMRQPTEWPHINKKFTGLGYKFNLS